MAGACAGLWRRWPPAGPDSRERPSGPGRALGGGRRYARERGAGACGRPSALHFPLLPPPHSAPSLPRSRLGRSPHATHASAACAACRPSKSGRLRGGGVGRGACDRRPVGHARRRDPRAGQGGREAAPHATRQAALPPPRGRSRHPARRPQHLPHAAGPASASECVRASHCGDPKARCAARPAADARPDSGPGQACGSPGARRQAAGRLFRPAPPAVDEPFARPLCVRVAHLLGRVLHEVRAGRD